MDAFEPNDYYETSNFDDRLEWEEITQEDELDVEEGYFEDEDFYRHLEEY